MSAALGESLGIESEKAGVRTRSEAMRTTNFALKVAQRETERKSQ